MFKRTKAVVTIFLLFVITLSLLSGCKPKEKATVKIGFIGPLTGPNAAVGIGAKNSFQLKVDQVLGKGDYPYNIEVLYEDDASDPATGVAAANKICSDPEVVAAGTHWNSPVALATISVFHKFGVAQVLWGTINPDITYKYNYPEVTRVIPLSSMTNEKAAEMGINTFKKMNWVIIHDTTDYGTTNRDEMKADIEKLGGKVIGDFGINVGQQDFMSVLSKVKELNPDAVYFGGVVTEGALVKTQMNKIGLDKILFMGMPGIQSDTFGKIAGAAAEGSFCSGTFDVSATDIGRQFQKDYSAKYTEPYEQNGPYAYDAAGIILEAIKNVGPDRQKIVQYIRSHDYTGVLGLTHFDAYGQTVTGGLTMYVNQDQKWIRWEESEYYTGKRKLPWQQ